MDTSDTEGDSTTMEVDGGMVAMDTNDERGFGEEEEMWRRQPDVRTSDIKDMHDLPVLSEPHGLVSQQVVPGMIEPSTSKMWRLPEGSCRKTVVQTGEGLRGPTPGSNCTVTLQISGSTSSIDPSQIGFPLGKWNLGIGGGDTPASHMMDLVLVSMKRGETAEVYVSGLRDVTGDFVFHTTLHDFVAGTPPWRMTLLEKCTSAKSYKERGTEAFKDGNIYSAFSHFRTAIRLLLSVPPFGFTDDDEADKSYQQLLCQCHLNLAACQMKTGLHQHVIVNCTQALSIDPCNVKALYRRASASISLGKYSFAREDLEKGLSIEPNNRVLAELLQSANAQLTVSQTQMVQGLSKMFS